ncbi:hypothetical protein [Rubritalea tangerina]|uniref:hypothetical protein n=1 Tax=Rubritalea tangerina TaxID=430798 RepID=UPI003614754A
MKCASYEKSLTLFLLEYQLTKHPIKYYISYSPVKVPCFLVLSSSPSSHSSLRETSTH